MTKDFTSASNMYAVAHSGFRTMASLAALIRASGFLSRQAVCISSYSGLPETQTGWSTRRQKSFSRDFLLSRNLFRLKIIQYHLEMNRQIFSHIWAAVGAQLAGRSLPISEYPGSNPTIGNFNKTLIYC